MASIRSGIGENMEERYLFKAKRLDTHDWILGFLSMHKTGKYFIRPIVGSALSSEEVDKNTICQCTGLKDKNGKLIWENDIVDFLGHKGIVKYECGSFGVAYRECIDWEEIESNICPVTGCDNALYACENDNFISLWEICWNFNDEDNSVNTVEVIGNIFDNPKLLESEV